MNPTTPRSREEGLARLQQFRQEIYDECFKRSRDALFNVLDALIDATQTHSFPELSLSPHFQRQWASLYEAFEDGAIESESLHQLFIRYLPESYSTGRRLVLAVDATSIERPFSQTSPDRTLMPMHNIPDRRCTPITAGWQYSTVAAVPDPVSSKSFILHQKRISSEKTANQLAFEQLQEIVPQLPKRPLVLMDRGYDCVWLWCRCSRLAMDLLVRLKNNRCFYRPAPKWEGKKGRPPLDGAKLQPKDPSTHTDPSGSWQGKDHKGHDVVICWWNHLHVKDARWLDLTVLQVTRPQAKDSQRDPRVSWFVFIGQEPTEAVQQLVALPTPDDHASVAPTPDDRPVGPDDHEFVASTTLSYRLRFALEHTYRFVKQELLWPVPRLRTPEQFDRWTQVVTIVHNLLILASEWVSAQIHPWESTRRVHTLQQVRRGLAKLLPELGTPARPPKPRGNSPGRSCGASVRRAPRCPVVRKTAKEPQLERIA